MISLYAQYMKERQGVTVVERENGFFAFKIVAKECFLAEMFVPEALRQNEIGRGMIDELCAIAQSNGCEIITANIHLKDPGATNTLRAALAVGFELKTSGHDVLLIAKTIIGG